MVLLDQVIRACDPSHCDKFGENTCSIEFVNGFGMGGIITTLITQGACFLVYESTTGVGSSTLLLERTGGKAEHAGVGNVCSQGYLKVSREPSKRRTA